MAPGFSAPSPVPIAGILALGMLRAEGCEGLSSQEIQMEDSRETMGRR